MKAATASAPNMKFSEKFITINIQFDGQTNGKNDIQTARKM